MVSYAEKPIALNVLSAEVSEVMGGSMVKVEEVQADVVIGS